MDCELTRCCDFDAWAQAELRSLQDQNRVRQLHPLEPIDATTARLHGRDVVLFSSNDYLGLAYHAGVRQAIANTSLKQGRGPCGSPLVCGFTSAHEQLCHELEDFLQKQNVLLFPSGYAANLGVISGLSGTGVHIFSDELNHASIVDGCRLAKQNHSQVSVFRHNDPDHLALLLQRSTCPRKLIITESVFSTQGDLAPLRHLVELKNRYGGLLIVDEGHGFLVFGEQGEGLSQAQGVLAEVDVYVGTLSKAAAGLGGFIAVPQTLGRLVLHRARSLIYSTASPLPIIAGLRAALHISRTDRALRQRLHDNIKYLSESMGRPLVSPIVPIYLGAEDQSLIVSQQLLQAGVHVVPFRPPTVPAGTSRLRLTLNAHHAKDQIDHLVSTLSKFLGDMCHGSVEIEE